MITLTIALTIMITPALAFTITLTHRSRPRSRLLVKKSLVIRSNVRPEIGRAVHEDSVRLSLSVNYDIVYKADTRKQYQYINRASFCLPQKTFVEMTGRHGENVDGFIFGDVSFSFTANHAI